MAAYTFFLLCFLCFPHFIASANNCSNNYCGKGEPGVAFPFRLKDRQDKACGYPGFDLTCNNMKRTVLELPFSEPFFVLEINYEEIQLQDPDNCLTRRFLNQLNLSGTPYIGINVVNYSFFNCSSNISIYYLTSGLYYSTTTSISCLSSPKHTVFAATARSTDSLLLERNCSLIATVPVPLGYYYSRRYPYQFANESVFHLTWKSNESNCKLNCYNTDTRTPYIGRSYNYKRTKEVLIGIGIIVPILVASIVYCKCYCGANSPSRDVSSRAVQITPRPVNNTSDFYLSALEGFPTVVLGESGRLSHPDINTCAICLSEYQPKETLKTLPACNHCFHADCIDPWLHLNLTCPICRKFSVPSGKETIVFSSG
ncbi:hypothetical protein MKW94_006167 [Papaver nudicaule]|uniref:RING-type E3 ubiquitin transferase n=1 Tax=Papaver nudicaule TaxID=74823 RepID=A0AA41V4T5_PAPNU|nr:hypothetical protein [Papaver nudicaule]